MKKWSETENLGLHTSWNSKAGLVNKRGRHFIEPVASTDPMK